MMGRQDDSAGKATYLQAWSPGSDPQNPHVGRRELKLASDFHTFAMEHKQYLKMEFLKMLF